MIVFIRLIRGLFLTENQSALLQRIKENPYSNSWSLKIAVKTSNFIPLQETVNLNYSIPGSNPFQTYCQIYIFHVYEYVLPLNESLCHGMLQTTVLLSENGNIGIRALLRK